MGGSLLGDKVGGHNVLEPAALGVPVIIGPSFFNFQEITVELQQANGIIVSELPNIAQHVESLLFSHAMRKTIAGSAIAFVKRSQGSLSTTLQIITD